MKFNAKLIIKSTSIVILLLAIQGISFAQEESEESPLVITGSVDVYYKYDFSDAVSTEGLTNRPTWFGENQNSVSIGMIDIMLEKTSGKTTFVGELAFGPRGDGVGGIGGEATAPGSIQNLYVSYAASDKLSFTGGFMGTFVGYEVISPTSNFNYSASYLFSNGPFQNAGFKLDYALSDKVGVMVGIFSSTWDSYFADPELGMDNFGTQLSFAPVDGWDIYANFISGSQFSQWDLTTGYQISDPFYLGLNVSQNEEYAGDDEAGFFGIAGYAQYGLSDAFSVGLRYENFAPEADGAPAINSFTISGNWVSGNLTIIPEFRFDSADQDLFADSDNLPTDSFAEFLVAAVYSF